MSGSEKIDLSEIANISEEEFKKQLLAWIDDRGVSRTLQSKLRAELFEHFNRTQLGRQIAVQHQKSHRIELSPLVLVLNTLVAEFLYVENCHFTLSVFSAEVPYKNTLPDFETDAQQPFRLAERELKDVFEAIGMTESTAKAIQKFYVSNDGASRGEGGNTAVGRSLLYCIFKILFAAAELNASKAAAVNGVKEERKESVISVDTNSSARCKHCSFGQKKLKKYQISSRYLKYLNRYLDILTDRIREMSKSLVEVHSESPSKRKSIADTSAALESNLKKTLDQINANVNHLTKSKRKSKKLQDFLQSIDRLSTNLETCASNMERLLVTVTNECGELKKPSATVERKENAIEVDYCTWLQELKTSENGRRFVNRLETSLQRTLAKEQQTFEKIYEEKMNHYRMLIKLHYKQKYAKNGKGSNISSPVTKNVMEHPLKNDNIASKYKDNNQLLSNVSEPVVNEKEEYVDRIVQSAKVRLQQLESESEKLDKSFQNYLKQQANQKTRLNEDITNIWQDYTFGKSLVESHNLKTPRKALLPHQTATNLKTPTSELAAEIDALVQLDSKNTFENPFKQFSSNKLFPKRRPYSATTKTQTIQPIKLIGFADQRHIEHIESLLQTISSESSYGRLPSPKRSGSNNTYEIPMREKPLETVLSQESVTPVREYAEIVNLPKNENDGKDKETDSATHDEKKIQHQNSNDVSPTSSVPSSLHAVSSSPPAVPSSPPAVSLSSSSANAIEPKKIVVEVEPAAEANYSPLRTQEFAAADDSSSISDAVLDESLDISIGPIRDASSSEDVW